MRAFSLGEGEQLPRETARTHRGDMQCRDFAPDVRSEIAQQQKLEMHLKPCERGVRS